MDYRTYITDFIARKGNADPTSLLEEDMQALMDTARNLELDDQAESVAGTEEQEVTDVTKLVAESPSLTGQSEPAMDSALLTQPSPESVADATANQRLADEPPVDSSPGQQEASLVGPQPESPPAELQSFVAADTVAEPEPNATTEPVQDAPPDELQGSVEVDAVTQPEPIVSDEPPSAPDAPPAELVTGSGDSDSPATTESPDADVSPAPTGDLVRNPTAEIPLAFMGPTADATQPESDSGPSAEPVSVESDETAPADIFTAPEGTTDPAEPVQSVESDRSPDATPEQPSSETVGDTQLNPIFLSDAAAVPEPTQPFESQTQNAEIAVRRRETTVLFPEGREAEFTEMMLAAEQQIMSPETGGLQASFTDPDYRGEELPGLPPLNYNGSTEAENLDRLYRISSDIQKWSRL